MELTYYPAPCCKRRAADNGDTTVATIGLVRNERSRSLSREDQGGCCQVPRWRRTAFPVAIVVAFAFTAAAVVSCLPAGCCVDASASCPLDSASAYQRATLASWGPIASCLLAPLLPFASCLPACCRVACCCVSLPHVSFRCAADG